VWQGWTYDQGMTDTPQTAPTILFIYNAKAGIVAGMMDSVHKTVSPDTYECALCAVTHGFFTMQRGFRDWLKALPYAVTFHHRPDFRADYPQGKDIALPAVLMRQSDGTLTTLLSAAQLKPLKRTDDLVAALNAALENIRA
jgi:hypothetical protein